MITSSAISFCELQPNVFCAWLFPRLRSFWERLSRGVRGFALRGSYCGAIITEKHSALRQSYLQKIGWISATFTLLQKVFIFPLSNILRAFRAVWRFGFVVHLVTSSGAFSFHHFVRKTRANFLQHLVRKTACFSSVKSSQPPTPKPHRNDRGRRRHRICISDTSPALSSLSRHCFHRRNRTNLSARTSARIAHKYCSASYTERRFDASAASFRRRLLLKAQDGQHIPALGLWGHAVHIGQAGLRVPDRHQLSLAHFNQRIHRPDRCAHFVRHGLFIS
jgi:hypothetical protein